MLSYYEKEEWILECRVSLHVYNIAYDEDSNDTTPSKRNNSNNIVGYLRKWNEAEIEYRKQELEMRKQQLKPDEEKFELEKKERMQKLENEKQEKKLMFDLLKKCLGRGFNLQLYKYKTMFCIHWTKILSCQWTLHN